MQNNQLQNQGNPRLRLPFEKRKIDFVTWTYIHRAGIYMIVIVFLLCAIAFVSCKIQVGQKEESPSVVMLDFQEVMTPEQERLAQQEEAPSGRSGDYADIANRLSNENARLNSSIRDAQRASASELSSQTSRLNEEMAANRAEYEAGLRSEQQILSGGGNGSGAGRGNRAGSATGNGSTSGTGSGAGSQGQDSKVKGGRVTVSFSFRDPVRTSVNIVVPAYLCEGGGEVVVNVTLNQNGNVISAAVNRSVSTSNECMRTEAEKAARNSRFNLDNSAPTKHSGTITYIFVPQ